MIGRQSLKPGLFTIALALFFSATAGANAGMPMLFAMAPLIIIGIIPIVLIECLYIKNSMKRRFGESLKVSVVANFMSTMIGIPITWLLLVILEVFTGGGGSQLPDSYFLKITVHAAWQLPDVHEQPWVLAGASIFLLIIFYFVSWWTEYLVIRHYFYLETREQRRAGTVTAGIANAITYFLMIMTVIAFEFYSG